MNITVQAGETCSRACPGRKRGIEEKGRYEKRRRGEGEGGAAQIMHVCKERKRKDMSEEDDEEEVKIRKERKKGGK